MGAAVEEADKLFSLPVADRLKSVIFRLGDLVSDELSGIYTRAKAIFSLIFVAVV